MACREAGLYFTTVLYRLQANYTFLKYTLITGTVVHGVTHFLQGMLVTAFFVGEAAVACPSQCLPTSVHAPNGMVLSWALRWWRSSWGLWVRVYQRCCAAMCCAGQGKRMKEYDIHPAIYALMVILSYSLIVSRGGASGVRGARACACRASLKASADS